MSAIDTLFAGEQLCECGHPLRKHWRYVDHDECDSCDEPPCSEFRPVGDLKVQATAELAALRAEIAEYRAALLDFGSTDFTGWHDGWELFSWITAEKARAERVVAKYTKENT